MSSAAEQGIPQTGEEDPLVLVDDPVVGEAIAELTSGQAGADLPQEALIAALTAEPRPQRLSKRRISPARWRLWLRSAARSTTSSIM